MFDSIIEEIPPNKNHNQGAKLVNIRQSYLAMIKNYQGGWDAMAGALGMSRDALVNHIYERKG